VPAAAIVGAAVFWGAGLPGALVLALFFVSGSVLTAWNARLFSDPKGPARNHRQVLANGTWAVVGAILIQRDAQTGWAVMAGALSAAQADTWATEIGRHSSSPPRLITTWDRVAHGASGGVTLLGTCGGVLGALVMAALAWLVGAPVRVAAWALAGGTAGMLVDSLLGATVQGDEIPTRGWRWFDNDVVNLVASAAGAGVALAGTRWM
jgi:uncharacterized protein (TIGR00297 family)